MKLGAVVSVLNQHTPPSLSEDWDNTGLLVEPCKKLEVSKILLTNDLTEIVTSEAIQSKAQLVIAYHPPIFSPIKRITQSSAKERILLDCIRHDIAIYSPHSSLDNIQGGLGDWMVTAFNGVGGTHEVSILKPNPLKDTIGAGRRVTFSQKVPLDKCVELIKSFLGLKEVRLALPDLKEGVTQHVIGSVCMCPGSGASVLRGTSGDLYWTGELSHHDVLDAISKGKSVVLCEHSNTERGYLFLYRDALLEMLERKVEIIISKTDKEPLSIV
ncbi:hypothetical protein LOD99_13583 [Oopsacas minuta]|uniref:NIF3-like protein 1 n=1 Tax=Oopsacas minuta TaxID=111878 RepID=A0AAV7KL05_9METZ|nr:hypothetical protein LOD99_13583 [Oopsacas minuta]